jgi:regulator of cell morphogenesis and NO signaling
MKVDQSLPVATIAADCAASRAVFESLGIDYSCGGPRSLADAAHAEGLDPEVLVAGLRRLAAAGKNENWNERPLVDLVRHLTAGYHHFVRNELVSVSLQLSDLCTPSKRPSADLQSLRSALIRLSETLIPHMHEEEDTIFREVLARESAWESNERPLDGDLRNSIRRMIGENGTMTAQLKTIRELRLRLIDSNDQSPQCRAMLDDVSRLEAHLHESMFLENCVLFPRAIVLQEQMAPA